MILIKFDENKLHVNPISKKMMQTKAMSTAKNERSGLRKEHSLTPE